MKKLLYVAPHLSTGGLPQYLTKKVELLKQDFEIHLVEWVDCTGGVLVVTRNKLVKLVDQDKFFTLGDNKHELIDIISRIKPDIIHLEEIPEFFMDKEIAQQIYTQNRDYVIVETSHDSSFDTTKKQFFPDKFMFVSDWQIQQYKDIAIPSVLVEYPIEYVERPDRTEALNNLCLNPHKKHVLHIGLFTPRKNQAEFFEYARSLPEYEFHCLGNQAQNFEWYWKPLMENKPANITWWNERTDVDSFYQSMDLFLFTSRGTNTDKETMPLVIREAVSNQIPILIYNLPVYLNYWGKFDNIDYLNFKDFDYNCQLITNKLEKEITLNIEEEAFVISTYPNTQSVIDTTKKCILSIKKTGRKIILTSHLPIPEELQELVDYCVYDKNNILTKHTHYKHTWFNYGNWRADIYLEGENNDIYHGPSVYTNYYNGASLALDSNIKKLYFINYDYIVSNPQYIDDISKILNNKKAYVGYQQSQEGKVIITFFLASTPELYLTHFPFIEDSQDYDDLMEMYGSESNGLENLVYHSFKVSENQIHWEEESDFNQLISDNFTHYDYSCVEYLTVLPTTEDGQLAIFYQNSNNNDSKKLTVTITEPGSKTINEDLNVDGRMSWYKLHPKPLDYIEVTFNIYNTNNKIISSKKIKIDQDYINNSLSKNGLLTLK